MRSLATIVIVLAGLSHLAFSQAIPSPLESTIGRLESGKTSLTIATVAFDDPARAGKTVRGLRLSFSSPDWTGTRFIDEASLPAIKEKLVGLVKITARFSAQTSGNGMMSTVCPGEAGKLPLAFGYHYGNSEPELMIGGSGFPEVVFIGVTPSQMAEVFFKAIDQVGIR